MGAKMLTKGKRVKPVLLAFLVTFTHNSFPLSWGVIGGKTHSYSVKSFNGIEKFLGTKIGEMVGQVVLLGAYLCLGYFLWKIVEGEMMEQEETEVYKRKKRKNALTFQNDYVGDPPPEIRRLMNRIVDRNYYADLGIKISKGLLIVGPPGV